MTSVNKGGKPVQLPHVPVSKRPQSAAAGDEFWTQKGTSGAINAFRQLSNHKRGRRKKASLPGGKLQPLFKNHTAPANLEKLGSKHSVLPHIRGNKAQRIRSRTPGLDGRVNKELLGGCMDNVPPPKPSTVRLYMAALQPDMSLESSAIMKTAVPRIQEYCSGLGLHFQLVDLAWGMGPSQSPSRSLREKEIAECKELSIGPHTVVLLGDSVGIGEPPSSMSSEEYELLQAALQEAGDTQTVDTLTSAYHQIQPDTYTLQPGGVTESEQDQLMAALRPIVQQATQQGKFTEERSKHFLHTDLSWDVETCVFSETHPRRHCLCYQREVTGLNDPTNSQLLELRHRLTEQLGNKNNRPFYLKASDTGVRPAPESEEYQNYLSRFTDTFAADVIELIRQDVEEIGLVQKASIQADIQAEIITHARIGLKCGRHFVGQRNALERIKNTLKDPQNNSPFAIYGPSGSGKTAMMAHLAHHIKEWFSSESVVVHRVLGATTQSRGIYSTVISLVQQLCLVYDLPMPEATTAFSTLYNTLCMFRDVIEQVAHEQAFMRPLFILLDGIDHLQPYEESLRALWAITHLPPNIHVIISTVPSIGKVNLISAIQMLITEVTAELEPLAEQEARDLVKLCSQSANRELSNTQIDKVIAGYKEDSQPLTLVQFTQQALERWSPNMTDNDLKLPPNAKQQLIEKLAELENRFGQNLVTLLSAYITCSSVGIHERDLQDLLSMNNDVIEEVHSLYGPPPGDVQQVPMGAISSIKYELRDYLEEHCAYGKAVTAWSHRDYYEVVADKYQVIFPGIDEQLITEESTSFTLMLHEYMANMYLPDDDNPEQEATKTITSPQPLLPANLTKLMRVPIHMKVLLPIEGLERAKKCMVFNFKWLQTKLEALPVYVVLQDIYALIVLTHHLVEEGVFEGDGDHSRDMEVLYECLQLSYATLVRSPKALATQLYGRLGGVKKYPMINHLLQQVDEWIKQSSERILCPVYPCFTAPEEEIRHVLSGPTHLVNFLSNESVAVMFSQKTGCDVWRVSTGELLHRFPVNSEQAVRGVVPGHAGEFVIIGHYSHLNHKMELGVWSTETGVQIISSNFPHRFDVFVLSADDQVMIFSTLIEVPETEGDLQCVIMGVNVENKEVLYSMPVQDIHTDGISQLIAVEEDISSVTNGLISIGSRSAKDLAFWDLNKQERVFMVGLNCFPSLVKVHSEEAVAVCASPESSTIIVVDLIQGKIKHSIHGSSLRDMNDILLNKDGKQCLVATQSNGVVIYSTETAAQEKSIQLSAVDGVVAMSTKLLVEEEFVLAGQSNGNIQILHEESGQLIHILRSHTDAINSLRFNAKQQLFSASDDGSARVWNGEKIMEDCRKRIAAPNEEEDAGDGLVDDTPAKVDVNAVLLTPAGTEVITATTTGVKVWNLADGKFVRELCKDRGVQSLLLAYKGKLLLTSANMPQGGGARLLKAWRQDSGAALPFSDAVESGGIVVYCSTLFASQDKLLVLSPAAETQDLGINVSIYELFSMSCISSMHCNIYGNMDASNLHFLGLSHGSPPVSETHLMLPGDATMVEIEATDLPPNRLHDKQRQQASQSLTEDNSKLYAVLDYFPSPNQSFFFTFVISADDKVSMDAYEPMHVNSMSPQCAVLLAEGASCITGTVDGAVVEWDVSRQLIVRQFYDSSIGKRQERREGKKAKLAHEGSVSCVNVKDNVLVSGGMEGTVKVWMLNSGNLTHSLSLNTSMVSCLSLSGSLLATGSVDGKLSLIDLTTGEECSSFYGSQPIRSVLLTGGSKHVVLTVAQEDKPQRIILLATQGLVMRHV